MQWWDCCLRSENFPFWKCASFPLPNCIQTWLSHQKGWIYKGERVLSPLPSVHKMKGNVYGLHNSTRHLIETAAQTMQCMLEFEEHVWLNTALVGKSFRSSEICWEFQLWHGPNLCPGGKTKTSYRDFLCSLVYWWEITLCSLSVCSGKGEQ